MCCIVTKKCLPKFKKNLNDEFSVNWGKLKRNNKVRVYVNTLPFEILIIKNANSLGSL